MAYDFSQQPDIMHERYPLLPEEIIELFEYDTVTLALEEIAKEFALSAEQKTAMKMEIELVLFLFLPRTGMVNRLQDSLEVDPIKAEQIAVRIEEELFIIVDEILSVVADEFKNDEKSEDSSLAKKANSSDYLESTLPPVIIVPPKIEPTNLETENVLPKKENLTQVKPLRTFAMDVDISRAHGYGATSQTEAEEDEPVHRSNQDDILKK